VLGLRKRHLPWLACVIVALIGIPALASAKGNKAKSAAPPPLQATIVPYDFGFRDSTKSKDDPTATTVTIAPGGRVDFNYPGNDGTNQHNVVFGDGNTLTPGPAPTSCTQTAGFVLGTVPPLPSIALPPPWAGYCTFNTAGVYKFYCQAHPGNMQAQIIVTSTGANTAPTVTASRNPTGSVPNGTAITFTANGSDADGDPLTYAWDFGDGDTATGAVATHTYPAAGSYTATVTVSDNQGGSGNTTVPVTVVASTNHAPTVTAGRTPTGTITSGTAVAFTAAGSDSDGDTLTYSWDFGDGSSNSTSQNPTHTYSATGTFAAKVTVSDGKGGNNSDTLSVTVVAPNQSPMVSITRNPTGNVTTGTSVAFTATASDPDGDPLTYTWDFGDSGTSTQQNPSHPYSAAGTYSAKVTVSDGHGGTATSNTLSITVTAANQNPTVSASRNPTGDVATGTAIAFTATGSDPDGDTLTYTWDFGDSGSGTGAAASHTYTTAGSYTAKVTASDGKGGSASATLPITVTTGGSCPPGFRDDFNGTALDSSWTVLRPDATDGGIVVSGGTAALPTGAGDIYQTTNTGTNFVLRTAPSGAFTVIAKINHHGNERYQQGGIIVYGDDDNYVKLDRTATNASGSTNTEFFEFIQEVAATARNQGQDHTAVIASDFPSDFYLRIVWDGTNMTGAYSTDGSAWTSVGRSSTALPATPKIGFFALSNGATTIVNPKFDYITIDGPPCGTNQNPVISSATADKTIGVASLPVNFTAAATDPDGDAVSYAWDFGDGGTATGATATHTYTTGGTFSAKVTVTDGKGGSATRTISITALPPDTSGAAFRALVFSKTAVFRHDSIPQGIAAIKTLGTQNNFQVDATEDSSVFRDDILSHYKTVIFLSTTGDVLTDDQQAAFERFIRAGNGYVGIHSAADTEYTWPWYGQLVGAYFRDHPNGTPQANVLVEDTTDPSDAGLPATWQRTDEWYNFQPYTNPVVNGGTSATPYNPRDNTALHILLKMDTSSYTGAAPSGSDHPISWCHRYDGGRSWYTGMGHTQASFSESGFLSHILAGMRITAGVLSSSACGVTGTNANPSVTATRNPTGSVTTGTSVAFSATGTDPDGDTLTYSWNFGDGSATSTDKNPTHTYTAAGTYTATVTVSDGKGGTGSTTLTVVVTQPNRNPTVQLSRNPAGGVDPGTAIAFTAAAADADGDTLTYAWDFGDSGTSNVQNPTHTYASAGTYTARVTVSDGKGGSGTDAVVVTVNGPVQDHTDTPQDVMATVPTVLKLNVTPSTTLGSIAPGVAHDYLATVAAEITSTAGDAALSVSDLSSNAPGHLVNGTYALASPVEAQATNATQTSAAFAPVGASPVTLLSYSAPVSSDPVTVGIRQRVSAGELLRAGSYSKTLTFTLTTSTP
jgi:PKD repeat protein